MFADWRTTGSLPVLPSECPPFALSPFQVLNFPSSRCWQPGIEVEVLEPLRAPSSPKSAAWPFVCLAALSPTKAHSRSYSGGDADYTDAGLWFPGAVADTEDSRRAGRRGPIRPDRYFLSSAGNGWVLGTNHNFTNHNATCFHFFPLCCSLLHWWSDPNTERTLRKETEGQDGGSANYTDLAKVCTALDVAAPHHACNSPFAFWVIKQHTATNVLGCVRLRYRGE